MSAGCGTGRKPKKRWMSARKDESSPAPVSRRGGLYVVPDRERVSWRWMRWSFTEVALRVDFVAQAGRERPFCLLEA